MAMPRYSGSLPEPNELEHLIRRLLQKVYDAPEPAQLNGVSGQSQHGVDAVVRSRDKRWIGAQCKRYLKRLTAAHLEKELRDAHDFTPKLDAYIVATTVSRNAKLQAFARNALLHGVEGVVQVWAREDLIDLFEEYGMTPELLVPYGARNLESALALATGKVLPVDTEPAAPAPLAGATPSPRYEAMARLMSDGQPRAVIDGLEEQADLDETEQLLLARAYYQQGRYGDVDALAARSASSRVLAISALAHARRENFGEANVRIQRALGHADTAARSYVVSTSLAVLDKNPGTAWEDVLAAVPPDLADDVAIRSALGDAAMAHGEYAAAAEHYAFAEERDTRPNTARRVAWASALVGRAEQHLPLAYASLDDPQAREWAAQGRDGLAREDRPSLDGALHAILLANLAAALALLDDPAALDAATRALDVDPHDESLWQRWFFLHHVFRRHLDPVRLAALPDDPRLQLMAADAEVRDGQTEAAQRRLATLLARSDLPAEILAIARAEALVLGNEAIDDVTGLQLFELVRTHADSAALAMRFASQLPHLIGTSSAEAFVAWANEQGFGRWTVAEAIGVAGVLVEHGFASRIPGALPALRAGLSDAVGEFDTSVAPLLLEVLSSLRLFVEADALAQRWLELDPQRLLALKWRVRVHMSLGREEEALAVLVERADLARLSPKLWHTAALLGVKLGQVRRIAKVFRGVALPQIRTAENLQGAYFALATLRDPRLEALVLEQLKPGSPVGEAAPALLGLSVALARRAPRGIARDNCLITLTSTAHGERRYWLGESSPMQGVASVPWLTPVKGKKVGDDVVFSAGPFGGDTFQITDVREPLHLLFDQARELAASAGEVTEFVGPVDAQIDKMRDAMARRQVESEERLRKSARASVPAVVMGQVFGRSPREFLHAQGSWVPRSHSGSSQELLDEEKALRQCSLWVIDPLTVCLIVAAELEPLIRTLPSKPLITRLARSTLRDWYLVERGGTRAMGNLSLRSDGRLEMYEYTLDDRRATRDFWQRLRRFVEGDVDVAPQAPDRVDPVLASLADALGEGTLTTLACVASGAAGLLSDEFQLRRLAASYARPTTSVRGLLAQAYSRSQVPTDWAIAAFVRLARLGRSFLSLPARAFIDALSLDKTMRRHALASFAATLNTAEPASAWSIILNVIQENAALRPRAGVDEKWLVETLCSALPPLPPYISHKQAANEVRKQWQSPYLRASRSAVLTWLRANDHKRQRKLSIRHHG